MYGPCVRGLVGIDMVDLTKRRRWRINPRTFDLEPIEGSRPGTFNGQDIRAQEWPPCPVCGATIDVDFVDVRGYADQFPVFVMGAWECPNDCDPRPVLRARAEVGGTA